MGNGILIAFEGADCAGKSSVLEKLKIVLPVIYDNKKFLYTREPGNLLSDNNESEEIRKEVLTNKNLSHKEQAELLAKARYLHTQEIVDKIKEGYIVITDRYLLSSVIYQGLTLGYEEVLNINKDSIALLNDNNIALENIVFKITEQTYEERMASRNEEKDAMEDIEKAMILDRIESYNSIENGSELKCINENTTVTINANGTDYDRILLDTLYHISRILKEEK